MNEEIKKICRVETSEDVLIKYSTDASIFKVHPSAVAYPKNVDELKKLVVYARGAIDTPHLTLSPRGAGTCMSGGSLTEGVMVDMKEGFTGIGQVDVEKRHVWVDSGVYYRDLEKASLTHGLLFPPYTSSKDLCCIGGMVGNNASGEKSLRYGATINSVSALKMVCSDGEEYLFSELTESELEAKKAQGDFEGDVYKKLHTLIVENFDLITQSRPRVRKNAAGYGLWNVWDAERKTFNVAKLMVGSQGTLGIITSILLDLVPAPKYTKMVVVPISNLTELAAGVKEILAHSPEGLETYDSHTYDLAKQYLPKEAGYAERAEGMSLVLFGQFAEDTQEHTDSKALECTEDLQKKGFKAVLIDDDNEQEAHWAIRRASYGLLKDHAPAGFLAVPFIEDTIVPIEHYGEFLEKLERILEDYKMTYTFAGHIGDGSIRLIPLIEWNKGDETTHHIFDLAQRTYELVIEFKGSISVDHNDGIIRTPYLYLQYSSEMLALFTQVKNIFDSQGMFNPGKKTLGTIEYAKAHVK